MASAARTYVRRRLGVLVAGAAVLTALMTVTAAASMPAGEVPAPGLTRSGTTTTTTTTSSPSSTRPRTRIPGFLLDRGRYTKFDAPCAGQDTVPASINNRGQIVGAYRDADFGMHGFLRDRAGRITTIDLPGAKATGPYRINDRGQIVGRYSQTHADMQVPDAIHRGFLLDHGRLTRIDVPGAAETQAVGINNRGQVVGEYTNPDGTFHGFLWDKGRFATIDKPGAAATTLIDINDRGQILGGYAGDDGVLHNFLLDRHRYIVFDVPGVPFTQARDLNNRGQIAGFTLAPTQADPLAGARGFLLAKGVKGPFTPIDVPGAPRNLVFGLNDRGQLVGSYENTAATSSPQATSMAPMRVVRSGDLVAVVSDAPEDL